MRVAREPLELCPSTSREATTTQIAARMQRFTIPLIFLPRINEIRAVIECVNECEAGNSPPDTGGVAAPSIKRSEATAVAQSGRSGLLKCFGMRSLGERSIPDHPVRSIKGGFATSS